MTSDLSIVVWNVQFRRRDSVAGQELRTAIEACQPDIVCITEASQGFLNYPYGIEASANYGLSVVGTRRKVLLWSRHPWQGVNQIGDAELPPGRYVAGCTFTPLGYVTVHGVCIPWSHAHVKTGRRDRQPWDEHLQYLRGLGQILGQAKPHKATLLIGDYNQAIPRRRVPQHVFQALLDILPNDLRCATKGTITPLGLPAIDHVVHTDDFAVASLRGLSNRTSDGRLLSDHFGLHLRLRRQPSLYTADQPNEYPRALSTCWL